MLACIPAAFGVHIYRKTQVGRGTAYCADLHVRFRLPLGTPIGGATNPMLHAFVAYPYEDRLAATDRGARTCHLRAMADVIEIPTRGSLDDQSNRVWAAYLPKPSRLSGNPDPNLGYRDEPTTSQAATIDGRRGIRWRHRGVIRTGTANTTLWSEYRAEFLAFSYNDGDRFTMIILGGYGHIGNGGELRDAHDDKALRQARKQADKRFDAFRHSLST